MPHQRHRDEASLRTRRSKMWRTQMSKDYVKPTRRPRGHGSMTPALQHGAEQGRLEADRGKHHVEVAHSSHPKPNQTSQEPQRLTCFYWFHQGKCLKGDDECLFAHYQTGQVADPPTRFKSRKIKDDQSQTAAQQPSQSSLTRDEFEMEKENQEIENKKQELIHREDVLLNRERDLRLLEGLVTRREDAVRTAENRARKGPGEILLLTKLLEICQEARKGSFNARRVLARNRERLRMFEITVSRGTKRQNIDGAPTKAMDGAIGAIAGLDLSLDSIEQELKELIVLQPNRKMT